MNSDKRTFKILCAFGIIAGFLFGLSVSTLLVKSFNEESNDRYELLQEDYNSLKEKTIICWDKLRELDPDCHSASDCSKNQELNGCEYDGCNWSCCNEFGECDTTLMACYSH